jgi:hypothetical protein
VGSLLEMIQPVVGFLCVSMRNSPIFERARNSIFFKINDNRISSSNNNNNVFKISIILTYVSSLKVYSGDNSSHATNKEQI